MRAAAEVGTVAETAASRGERDYEQAAGRDKQAAVGTRNNPEPAERDHRE